ncbi:MAG: rhomboid family intramembrane serine protease [Bacteroides sp.]|nr:rhomboid family intramembrane serine protease [Bacteroides sp.]MDE7442060.1 rhomboid family intramembrane serine protease [Muribaculaceae bacterium]
MNNFLKEIPPVTKNLIIVNLIIWLAMVLFPNQIGYFITNRLGLHYISASLFNPAQLITYMFVHDSHNFFHILFNMFTLWMFGRILEQVWGSQRFFVFYMICGIGAALVQEGVWALTWEHEYISDMARLNGLTYEHMKQAVDAAVASGDISLTQNIEAFKNMTMIVVGASGAIFGLLLGFAFVFPNMPLYLFFIPIPIKAKYMVIGYGVIEFFLGVGGAQSTVAHFAHLGGMLFGLILLLYWKKKGTLGGNYF